MKPEQKKLVTKYQNLLVAFGNGITHSEMDEITKVAREMLSPDDATVFLHQIELLKEQLRKNLIILKKITSAKDESPSKKAPDANRPNHTPDQKATIGKIRGALGL